MIKNSEQIANLNKNAIDALMSIANTALASAERLTTLNLNTARSVLEDGTANVKAMSEAGNPQELINIVTSQTQPAIAKATAYGASLQEISGEAQAELTSAIEKMVGEYQKSLSSLLEEAAKNSGGNAMPAFSALQNVINSANSAFGNLQSSARQLAEQAQANMQAVNKATTAAISKSK